MKTFFLFDHLTIGMGQLCHSHIILFIFRSDEAAQEALTDMPPRQEEELDPCTLHNIALMNMDANPTSVSVKICCVNTVNNVANMNANHYKI